MCFIHNLSDTFVKFRTANRIRTFKTPGKSRTDEQWKLLHPPAETDRSVFDQSQNLDLLMTVFSLLWGDKLCWKGFTMQSRRRAAAAKSVMKQSAPTTEEPPPPHLPRLCLCQPSLGSARLPDGWWSRFLTGRGAHKMQDCRAATFSSKMK